MRQWISILLLGGWLFSFMCLKATGQGRQSETTELFRTDCSSTNAMLDIKSERMTFDQRTHTFTFEEKVRVHRCDMTISSDRLHVISDVKGENIERVTAMGNVHFEHGTRHILAEQAEFFPAEQRLVLTGAPRAWDVQEQQEMTGEEITVFLQERNMIVKRARVLFHPRKVISTAP
jgi:lipopolysaccharide transport protein LptA